MKTIVKGKVVKNTYSVVSHAKKVETDDGESVVYDAKPELVKEPEVVDWVDLCSFDHEPYFNKAKEPYLTFNSYKLNIGDEEVSIDKQTFVANLDELHLFSDKVVEESDDTLGKSLAEIDYASHLSAFNESLIANNEKMKAYCKVHKMDPGETNAIELFKLVYNTEHYVIYDGKIYNTSSDLLRFTDELKEKIRTWDFSDDDLEEF